MARLEPVELRAGKARDNFRRDAFTGFVLGRKLALRRYYFDELARDNVNLVAVFERRVLKIRMHGNAEVRRQRPRRGGPDQHEHLPSRERRIDQSRIAAQW